MTKALLTVLVAGLALFDPASALPGRRPDIAGVRLFTNSTRNTTSTAHRSPSSSVVLPSSHARSSKASPSAGSSISRVLTPSAVSSPGASTSATSWPSRAAGSSYMNPAGSTTAASAPSAVSPSGASLSAAFPSAGSPSAISSPGASASAVSPSASLSGASPSAASGTSARATGSSYSSPAGSTTAASAPSTALPSAVSPSAGSSPGTSLSAASTSAVSPTEAPSGASPSQVSSPGTSPSTTSGPSSGAAASSTSSSTAGSTTTTSGAHTTDTGSSKGSTTAPSTTAPSTTTSTTSTTVAYLTAPFVVSGSITVPAQTAIESGTFSTTTLSDHTGPPDSYSATTVTGSDHHPTIVPVWFDHHGHPVVVFPVHISGPPGIIPPPSGFPTLDIGPDGKPTPDPNQKPEETAKPTKEPESTTATTSSTSTSSSTPTPTASATPYLIVPKDSASKAERESFDAILTEQVGKSNIQSATDFSVGIAFWRAPLNSTQVKQFSSNSIIDSVAPDDWLSVDDIDDPEGDDSLSTRSFEPVLDTGKSFQFWKRASPIQQKNAPPELAVISQPKNQLVPSIPNEYQYDPSAGKGITVYVVDSGASTQNPEYINMPGSKRWLFPGFGKTPDHNQDDKFNHGSCVLSKVAGPTFGVAKNVDVVVVKLQADTTNGFKILTSTYMDAMIEVKNDILNRKLQGKAVINCSFGFSIPANDRNAQIIKKLTQEIVQLDVPFTIAAGNDAMRGRPDVDRYPALWANDIDGLIVVGATDNDGNLAPFSQGGPLVSVWAPADGISCADNGAGVGTNRRGTSFAAPAAAGLAAYFMGLPGNGLGQPGSGKIAANVKNLMASLAWPRKKGAAEKVIWNNQNAGCQPGVVPKRDGSDACSLTASTDTATATGSAKATATGSAGSSSTERGPTSSTAAQTPTSKAVSTKSPSATPTPDRTTTSHTTSHATSHTPEHTTSHTTSPTTSHTTNHTSPATSKADSTTTTTHTTTTEADSTTTQNPTTTNPLFCAPSNYHGIPTGVPQADTQSRIDKFCGGMKKDVAIGDDSIYPTDFRSLYYQYFMPGLEVVLNISVVQGNYFVINQTVCQEGLSTVLNGCPPFSAPAGKELIKYGGSLRVSNGTGGVADVQIILLPDEMIS